jgi:chromosome segregation ATPase
VSGKGIGGGGKWIWPKKTVKPPKGGWVPRTGNAWTKGSGKHGDDDEDQDDEEDVTLERSIKDLEKTVAGLEQVKKCLEEVLGEKHSMVKATEGELEAFRDQLQVLRVEKRSEIPLSKQLAWLYRNKKDMEDKLGRTRDVNAELEKQEMQLVEKMAAAKERNKEQEAKLQGIIKEIATLGAQVAKEGEKQEGEDEEPSSASAGSKDGPGRAGAAAARSPNQGKKRGASGQGQRARGHDLDTDSDGTPNVLGLQE